MNEIQRPDVQCCRDPDPAATAREPFDEVEADLSVIQAPVDVRSGDVEERGRTDRSTERGKHLHRKCRRGAGVAVEHRLVGGRKQERHVTAIISPARAGAPD